MYSGMEKNNTLCIDLEDAVCIYVWRGEKHFIVKRENCTS